MKYVLERVDAFEEHDLLLAMQKECLPDDDPIKPEADEGAWWIAYSEDNVAAAFCTIKPSQRWQDVGYLSRAGVLKPHRGQGLQRRLIRVRCRFALAQGWHTVTSDTSDNPPSANNLIACGFRTFTPRYPWGFRHTIYWRKHLTRKPNGSTTQASSAEGDRPLQSGDAVGQDHSVGLPLKQVRVHADQVRDDAKADAGRSVP